MKKISTLGLIILLVAVVVVPTVYAGLLYNNGAPNQQTGNEMTMWIQAEDFMLSNTQTINEVKFWATATGGAGYTGDINYFIYNDISGSPGSVLASGDVFVEAVATSNQYEYSLDFNIPGFYASADTKYWLGLHNGDYNNNTESANFFWETTNFNGTSTGHELELPDGSWSDNGDEHAFELLGGTQASPVPIPAAVWLLGSGLIGLVGIRRKFQK